MFTELLHNRSSVRAFRNEPVEDKDIDIILSAMSNTASSNFGMRACMIRISSQE
ncbi:hypothetical protein [Corynebacterium sp. ES2715-CONJ3]|uniref:hypothetical protein n=1 Tax=Corynebacterium sp. ES2715-CONJ3 TaxID=2974028 RepID=UPI002168ACE6|nr:hypothetical protein [Corynebacterium sp. ES2715-CONJ3]MCS4491726.1 hypothetical protein [Corynebacterium sp. ES2715-CONJ3]